MPLHGLRRASGIVASVLLSVLAVAIIGGQESQRRFGGAYAELDARRQQLVDDWVARFAKVTGQQLPPRALYDDILSLSTKTTFDAVTHALMTTRLTDASGKAFGDGLTIIERVDSVKGEIQEAASDRQFRMYVRLTANAREMLERSREFKRSVDNSVYHKGYPVSYRQQRGTPSIQVSIALDDRQADVDVDYRSARFPTALFNGHLSAANSDVRAGNNAERHAERWSGFQNWWRGFFGVRLERSPDAVDTAAAFVLPKNPRAGDKDIEVAVSDFLQAWLIEGDIVAAMGYVSERSYACLALDDPDPSAFDRGVAPFQLLANLKATHEAIGKRVSRDTVTTGAPLTLPGLRQVSQAREAQFLIYEVPQAMAARFDCASRLRPGGPTSGRATGQHFVATFNIAGSEKGVSLALLWVREGEFWKIVSWRTAERRDDTPVAAAPPGPEVVRIAADLTLVNAAHDFVESWLVRKNYDAAFGYLSTSSYGCYDILRGPDAPASTSLADAGRRTRGSLERIGAWVSTSPNLEAIIEAAEPLHPSIRVMDQPHSRLFSLTSFPSALGEAVACDARARGTVPPDPLPLVYGDAFGMTFRFRTQDGEAPVLRLLWRKEAGTWRITAYDVEVP